MPCVRSRWITLGLLLSAPVLPAQNLVPQTAPQAAPAATTSHHKSHKAQTHKAQPPLVLQPLPGGPLSQLPMDQIPATPAKVSFQGGLLTISAQNSTLGEILRDVRKLTGASIEIPQGSGASERVVTHLGPGAPRDVLAGLLNGSSFNYVMVGSSSDPTAVSSVILSAKPSAAGETQSAANVYQNNPVPSNPGTMPPTRFPQPMPFNQQNLVVGQPGNGQPGNAPPGNGQPATADAEDKDDDSSDADDNSDDQAQAQPGQPDATDANAQVQQQQPDPNQPNAGPKTPEQIMEMLRRTQQQPGGPGMTQPPPQQ
jgi:hypothetical protein